MHQEAMLKVNYWTQYIQCGRKIGLNTHTADNLKTFLPTPNRNKKNEVLILGRCRLRRLIELITGHNNLNYLQSKIYPDDVSELCRFCEEEEETFEHLLNECPCFLIDRRDILFSNPIINTLEWKPSTLLQFASIPVINEALNFE